MRKFSFVLLPLLSLAACGGGDDTVTQIDGSTPIDGSSNTDAAPVTCTVSTATFGALGTLTGSAIIDVGQDAQAATDDLLEFDALVEQGQPADLLSVQLYAGYGAFPGAITTGTFPITGDELDFATCGVCIALLTNATQTGFDDTYFATGGSITVTAVGTAVGQTFAASLSNVTFTHVTINEQTLETTPVGDGCDSALTGADFSGTLAAPMN